MTLTIKEKNRAEIAYKVYKILLRNGANGTKKKEIIQEISMSNKTYVWIMEFLTWKKLAYCSDKEWYPIEKLTTK